jgi:hypothetical protein
MQAELFVSLAYRPLSQLAQSTKPTLACEYFPSLQSSQSVLFSSAWLRPFGHVKQPKAPLVLT